MTNIILVFGLILLVLEFFIGASMLSISITIGLLIFILIIRNFNQEERIKNLEQQIQEILGIKEKIPPKKVTTSVVESQTKKADYQFIPPVEAKPLATSSDKTKEFHVPSYRTPEPKAITWIKNWLFTGNPIAKIGILILFFGVAFLLKYVTTHYNFPIAYRLIAVFISGLLMVGIGWRLPTERRSYADILQGGGIGLMYLTIFAAFSLYHLLQAEPAFIILICIVALSGLIAVVRDAQALAITGILGGFLAPLLINTGMNNHIFLFSYYLILNAGILSIAWFKSWENLTFIGFLFTFVISALWGYQSYLPENYFSTQIFLVLYFLFYVGCSILFTSRHSFGVKHTINLIITFGTPIIAFILQSELVKHIEYGLAWSAFILAIFYAITAYAIYFLNAKVYKKLSEVFAGFSVLFATITIPLTFSKLWTSTYWALESLVLMWFGVRQNQTLIRLASGLVLLASTVFFVINMENSPEYKSFLNEYYLSGIFIVLANLICSYLLFKHTRPKTENDNGFATIFFIIGIVGWYYLNVTQIYDYVNYDYQYNFVILFFAITSLVAWIKSEYLNWDWLRYPALALLPIMAVLSIPLYPLKFYHGPWSLAVWIISFAILYFVLYRHEKFPKSYLPILHLLSFIFIMWFVAKQITTVLLQHGNETFTWHFIAWGIVPSIFLCIVCFAKKYLVWPLEKYEVMYINYGGYIISLYLFAWFLVSNLLAGDFASLPYLPFINPLDATIALGIFSVFIWYKTVDKWLNKTSLPIQFERLVELMSLVIFIWLNAVLLRTLYHWYDIPYTFPQLWDSMIVQACLSILWTVMALIATFIAAKYQHRILWFLGFGLIWLVILKLFLVDLVSTNTLERVFTFLGVGILLLINGYISPLPPKEKKLKNLKE